MGFETPMLWFTYCIDCKPQPWRHFKVEGVMVNAYEILNNNAQTVRASGIHRYLGFSGYVMMDSGGYQFLKKGAINTTADEILRLYEETKPNLGVVLDYPITPNLAADEVKSRLQKTLDNTRTMLEKHDGGFELVPVIHGYNLKLIDWYLRELEKIGCFNIYGVGSLVPSVFNSRGVGGIHGALKVVLYVRKRLPDKLLHVFGVGSALTMHLMFYAGADSIDSSSWRTKAAFGAIQLPGVGDRYITRRNRHKRYPDLSKDEEKLLESCGCPACRSHTLEDLRNSFRLRALHNAWVYQKEVETVRKLIRDGNYEQYVFEVLRKTSFSNALEVLINKIRYTQPRI